MNTDILKYDVKLQKVLLAANILCGLACVIDRKFVMGVLILQLITGTVQLLGSGLHLRLKHKSIGYYDWRLFHFWGSFAYMAMLYLICYFAANNVLWAVTFFIIPQFFFIGYFALCVSELHFLENREFFILR